MNNNYENYFTETEDGLNIEANNIDANCITSRNNTFSIDSSGNINCNNINANNLQSISFDLIYPVGSIYMNINNIDPNIVFGGTWVKIEDAFLIGASENYELGTTGGSVSHSHTMGAHTHNLGDSGYACLDISAQYINQREVSNGVSYTQNLRKTVSGAVTTKSETRTYATSLGGKTGTLTSASNTGNTTILPPYIAVNIWKRVS